MAKRNQKRTKGSPGRGAVRRARSRPSIQLSRARQCRPYIKVPATDAVEENFWDVPALCTAYQWPTSLPGGGVIALVEFGGGWVQPDLDQFFAGIGQPVPTVKDCSVDDTQNRPKPPSKE